ncbi:MAG: type IVB secretion system apparatus protein IcmL/DotI [Gammaproteobacteria bacterium]
MADDALELVRLRNDFYRDNYRKIVGILLFAIVIVFILAGALVYQISHPPTPKYFATDIQGRMIRLTPLDQPNLSQSALLQWANLAAVAAFTYNFVNYRQELEAASEFFTPDGWQNFISELQSSNNLKAVIDKKLVVSAVATGAPVILQQGVLDGRYAWRVQMPILVSYQSASQITQQNLVVTMLIIRISTLNSARGIGIEQFVAAGGGTI